jgi:hypothetical protein
VEFLDFEGSSVPLHVNDRWDSGFYQHPLPGINSGSASACQAAGSGQ